MAAEGRLRMGTVGPFWTTSGTRWDQNPGQAPKLFEPSNTLPNRCRPLSTHYGLLALRTTVCMAYVTRQFRRLTVIETGLRVPVVGRATGIQSRSISQTALSCRIK